MRKLADTFVIIDQVDAGTAILARIVRAIVDVCLAIGTSVSSETLAAVSIQMIVASAAMLTRIRAALVDICLASLPTVTGQTVADKLVHTILAGATVHARITRTLVHIAQASSIVITTRTFAPESIYQIYATATISARIAGAFVDVRFAVLPGKTWLALARISGRKYVTRKRIISDRKDKDKARFCCVGYSCVSSLLGLL